MKLKINFYNHLRHQLNDAIEVEVTNENIKQLCLDSLKVGDFEYENMREQIKEAFCYAIEKDLREKGVIDENETVEYYTVLTE